MDVLSVVASLKGYFNHFIIKSAVQINFAGKDELREYTDVGTRVAKNIVWFREENFQITPANIYDIHKLKTPKRLLQLIDVTDRLNMQKATVGQPINHKTLSQFMNVDQPNRMYSDNQQQVPCPATPVQAQAQPSPQLVDFSSPHQVVYQLTAQHQLTTKY